MTNYHAAISNLHNKLYFSDVPGLKITIITVCYNAVNTIERCILSVGEQTYPNTEHIIIDGVSTDGTVNIITKYNNALDVIVSEPDNGIYDAMNKGIALATGDIIGMLNADDFYADKHVLANIAEAFTNYSIDALYGDLDYINTTGKVIRKWRSGNYSAGKFNFGWMPPHPTFFCRIKLYQTHGLYSLDYGTAADYELMLRFIHLIGVRIFYLQKIVVKMNVGGVSNNNLYNRVASLRCDYRAMKKNKIKRPIIALILKPLSKLQQFF